ncbi:Uncharacterised protein [uncultured archaeon]|nr:Uncharacterised protein [uncultured archaeon]
MKSPIEAEYVYFHIKADSDFVCTYGSDIEKNFMNALVQLADAYCTYLCIKGSNSRKSIPKKPVPKAGELKRALIHRLPRKVMLGELERALSHRLPRQIFLEPKDTSIPHLSSIQIQIMDAHWAIYR